MLEVKIHRDYATMDNMLQYEGMIRSIIGDRADLRISSGGAGSWDADGCDPRLGAIHD